RLRAHGTHGTVLWHDRVFGGGSLSRWRGVARNARRHGKDNLAGLGHLRGSRKHPPSGEDVMVSRFQVPRPGRRAAVTCERQFIGNLVASTLAAEDQCNRHSGESTYYLSAAP